MSQPSSVRLVKKEERAPVEADTPTMYGDGTVNNAWKRASFKSQMVMLRCHVEAAINGNERDNAEFIYSQLMEQCRKLSHEFGFSMLT
jgi:hypothetical protein